MKTYHGSLRFYFKSNECKDVGEAKAFLRKLLEKALKDSGYWDSFTLKIGAVYGLKEEDENT